MITVDEATQLANTIDIPFPTDWRIQMERNAESVIRMEAEKGRKHAVLKGQVSGGRYYTPFHITAEQFAEVSTIIKQSGFRVDEHFKVRYDGQPLDIDIYW